MTGMSTTNGTTHVAKPAHRAARRLSPALLLLGTLLIILSWTPVGRLASEASWGSEDAAAYTRLVAENHRLGYENADSSRLTQEELDAQRRAVDAQLDAMIEKLEYAKSRPQAWSRGLFWTGAGLAALGTLIHLHHQGAAPSGTSRSDLSSLSRSHQTYKTRDQ